MAKESNTARIGFEEQIWAAADILRGNMDATEYQHVVLGLIFLTYISDKFDARYQELKADGDDVEDQDAYTEENIFFMPPSARWNVIAEAAHHEEIGSIIDEARRSIEKENRRLKDILPKNHASNEFDKRRLGNVVDLFTKIKIVEHGENKDIMDSTNQYCLQQFAGKESKRDGEYYTPSCMVRTLVAVLKPTAEHRIYDPCCGNGGMFVQSEQLLKITAASAGRYPFTGRNPIRPRARWQ
ncbi:MAG: class I SAM-dependent DNA methyltransferase [Victivallaceae bacterium]|nr:class I SAM-dependent DNA methyltransferase [Victivallaceae bacterium]